jgi:hypothetical protein
MLASAGEHFHAQREIEPHHITNHTKYTLVICTFFFCFIALESGRDDILLHRVFETGVAT